MKENNQPKKLSIGELKDLLQAEDKTEVYIKPDGTIDIVNLTEKIAELQADNARLREALEEILGERKGSGFDSFMNRSERFVRIHEVASRALGRTK